jgi:DNA primase
MEIENYLDGKNISYKRNGSELITRCIFNDCDLDSRSNEAHLYINADTGQYHCKKCDSKGNLVTLKQHFGDLQHRGLITISSSQKIDIKQRVEPSTQITIELVEEYHKNIPDRIRKYLNQRGINDELINKHKIGYVDGIYGKNWITIPIKGKNDKYLFFKLRIDPETKFYKAKYITYPKGHKAEIFDWETIKERTDYIVICEGEFDKLVLESFDIPAVTNSHGAGTFKSSWYKEFLSYNRIYICYDNDNTGKTNSEKIIAGLLKQGCQEVYQINLPDDVGEKGDITDYICKLGKDPYELFEKFSERIIATKDSVELPKEVKRIIEVPEPEQDLSFEEWKKLIKENFPEFVFPAEIIASILAQLLIYLVD